MRVLITGGAGFIGSNLAQCLLDDERVEHVRVLDNLSNGDYENIKEFETNKKFKFIKGDIRDLKTCIEACEGIDRISHQAALGSVPRSINDPILSANVNIIGTINVMYAAIQNKIDRVILAFSSSTYGDHPDLPKIENIIGNPLSPYAVTKASIEQFARVFGQTYGLDWIGLRYFNVFGPKQQPNNPYAAVIPIFSQAFLKKRPINVFGDGETSRDFTYVKNITHINKCSLFTESRRALCETYNAANSERHSLNQLVALLREISGNQVEVTHTLERAGDVRHSLASIEKAKRLLSYSPEYSFRQGLEETYEWYTNILS